MSENPESKKASIADNIKQLAGLYIENAKLTTTEKLSLLFSGIALFVGVMFLALIAMIFIAIGIASLLESYIAPFWSYFIIAAIFLIAVAVLYFFRSEIVENPIARFISKILLNPPTK